jgi:hypothetical protein
MLADVEGWSNDTGKTGKFTTVCVLRANICRCKRDGVAVFQTASLRQPACIQPIRKAGGLYDFVVKFHGIHS